MYIDRKDHRNGIKRPKKFRHESRRGVSKNLIIFFNIIQFVIVLNMMFAGLSKVFEKPKVCFKR